jgi:uncharacterized phiE125 gp8 family phage protein
MAIKRIGLALDVITLAEAKAHLRILSDVHPDDNYISTLITAAREWCEEYTGIAIGTQTLEIALDAFPTAIRLVPMVQSVTSVKYIDVSGIEQIVTATDYIVDNYSSPAWIVPVANKIWPSITNTANAVKIRFIAGFDVAAPCPKPIIAAMQLLIGNFYENRQEDVLGNTRISFNSLPTGVYSLLQPYRINLGV